ncbi:hypothetical protein KC953_00410 [Candidatus Saccharibacteria bacterium]|nr:hypothetical protein [Candidatus Saccharibacteria bacterium]
MHVDDEQVGTIGRKNRAIVLVVFVAIAVVAVVLTVQSVMRVTDEPKPGLQYGVGADGFSAFVEKDGNIGVSEVVDKSMVVNALGERATSVEAGKVDKVFNLNGNLGQTITFTFIRTDGVKADLYIDKRVYKSSQALEDDRIYQSTLDAGKIKGHPLYYRAAQTLGPDREYHLMVVDGLTVYRFVVAQPFKNITISEVDALAALKTLASTAHFN